MDKVLFWDFDGTLSYPNKSLSTALYRAVCQSNFKIDEQEIITFSESVYSWKKPEVAYPLQTGKGWWDMQFEQIRNFLLQHEIPQEYIGQIFADYREKLIDISNYALYDDTVQTLTSCLAKGYKNYLVTNNYPEISQNLTTLNIAHFFTGHIISSHIGYEKPRKEFFDYAKEIAGNPKIAYIIGDNPIADIEGGKKAGFLTIAVHACQNSSADYYCKNLSEIIAILD